MSKVILPDPERDAALRSWLEALCGGRVVAVHKVAGGAYRTSCRVTMTRPDGGPTEAFLKIDLGSAPNTPFKLRREYDLLRRLEGSDVPGPRALGFHDELQVMAMACLPGEARYDALTDPEARARIDQSFVEALAQVHRTSVERLQLEYVPPGRNVGEAIAADLDLWEKLLLSDVKAPDNITLFAFAWLRARLPADSSPAVLVQGDAGPGNFLYDAHGVTGLVDWEMAHLGHPLEDIGCVLARSLVQPMMSAARGLELYQDASGRTFTPAELAYATILVMTRFSVPIALALESRKTGIDYGLTNGYFRLSQISILRLIAQAEGIATDDVDPETGLLPPVDFELKYLQTMLRDIVRPDVTDDYVRYRLDGAIALLAYVERVVATDEESVETESSPTPVDKFREVVAGGATALRETLHALLGEALHRESLMREMLGPLYGRRVTIDA